MFNYLSFPNYTKLLPSVYINSEHLVLSHLALNKKVMLRANFYFSFNQHFFSFLEMDSELSFLSQYPRLVLEEQQTSNSDADNGDERCHKIKKVLQTLERQDEAGKDGQATQDDHQPLVVVRLPDSLLLH